MAFDKQHRQPGRRFAKGATWDDIKLGSFGFVSHVFLFMFLGALVQYHWPDYDILLWVTGIAAGLCLFIRGGQVGSSTTKESIAAIQEAHRLEQLEWEKNPPNDW